jgi:hypothetical protein
MQVRHDLVRSLIGFGILDKEQLHEAVTAQRYSHDGEQ